MTIIEGSGLPPFFSLEGVAISEKQNLKIKMQNDKAKGKIPNPKSEILNNIK